MTTIKYLLVVVIFISLAVLAAGACKTAAVPADTNNPPQATKFGVQSEQTCVPGESISEKVKKLSSRNPAEVDEAKRVLFDIAQESPKCRQQVIGNLISTMDKPNLDFTIDEDSYRLWLHGSKMLGRLKATEALDLLIFHLTTQTKTVSASMDHQPALSGVIEMGEVALPRLDVVLKSDSDPARRQSAVYCIATIGGPDAVQFLNQALATESDKCVSRFIRVSLDSFDSSGKIQNRAKWFGGISCNE